MSIHVNPASLAPAMPLVGSPRQVKAVRSWLQQQIEHLIAILDALEPEPDQEPTLGWGVGPQVHLHGSRDDGELEPSLASVGGSFGILSQASWSIGANDDREQDAGDEGEPDEDGEPTLGAPIGPSNGSQLHWAQGRTWDDEAEDDRADAEPSLGWTGIGTGFDPRRETVVGATHHSHDQEPDLGSLERASQPRWGFSGRDDREHDDGENGIGDRDGLDEQMGRVL